MPLIGKKEKEMIGNKGLLDSNVIIEAAKGRVSIQDIVNEYNYLYTSLICYVETLGYDFDDEDEKNAIIEILKNIEIVNLNKSIADVAIAYRRKRRMKLPDALIFATDRHLKCDLLTSNIADFQHIDSTVRIVIPK